MSRRSSQRFDFTPAEPIEHFEVLGSIDVPNFPTCRCWSSWASLLFARLKSTEDPISDYQNILVLQGSLANAA